MNNIAVDLTRDGKRAIFCLYIWLLCESAVAASALLTLYVFGAFPGGYLDNGLASLSESVSGMTAAISLLAYLVTSILVLRWIYLSARAAYSVSHRMTVTPGWAVGRFFLPIVNLWTPYQGIAEIWRVSVAPAAPDVVPTPVILRWWWGLWLASSLFGHIGGRLTLQADTAKGLINAAWADLVLFALNVPLVVVLVRIITQLSAIQATLLTRAAGTIDGVDAP